MTTRLVPPLLLLAACIADERLPPPEGPHYQYVVSELHIPQNNAEARTYSLDLDGDGTVDNQLGMVFATLDAMGLGVDDTAREALVRGGLIMLADLQTPAFDDTDVTAMTTYLGQDPSPAPCSDPMQLETCGQHLLGTGQFAVQADSASDLAAARMVDGIFSANLTGKRRLPVEIALISPDEPIHVVLEAARVRATSISPTGASVTIAGGITKADVDGVVVPEAARQVDRIVGEECGKPTSSPCGCVSGQLSYYMQQIFDENDDCDITAEELLASSLVASLFGTDLRIDGVDMLSFGVGVELVSATFPPP